MRLAIDCLPLTTREEMLAGVSESDRVIAGAYVDERGGVCPMLAAHRRGARIDFLSFARSWDRFTRASRVRAATARERTILLTQLEASIASASNLELEAAIADHRKLRAARTRGSRALREEAEPRGKIVARRLRRARAATYLCRKPARSRAAAPAAAP